MEGGLSRKRGYTVLVALLAAALLALLLWRGCRYENPTTETIPVDTAMLAMLDEAAQPRKYPSRTYGTTSYGTKEGTAGTFTDAKEWPAKGEGRHRPAPQAPIELNTADTAELQRLWGIGPVLSARIVRYRDLLGGFTGKEQLREVYGLADSVYERIAPQVTADAACVRRMDINTATYGQLLRHPYLDKHQVAAIVRLREKQGAFQSLDDLHQIPIIEQETYTKITPYLSCNSQQKR